MSRSLRIAGLCLALALLTGIAAKPAFANRDVVHFGNSIDVPEDATIHDAVCFFCSVNVKGTAQGDIVTFFGSVNIDGKAEHDVVDFFGAVRAANDSSIGHDVVNFFGGVRLGENVSVGEDLVVMFGDLHMASSASVRGDRVVQPGWIFWGPLLVFGLIIYVIVREVRASRRRRMLGY